MCQAAMAGSGSLEATLTGRLDEEIGNDGFSAVLGEDHITIRVAWAPYPRERKVAFLKAVANMLAARAGLSTEGVEPKEEGTSSTLELTTSRPEVRALVTRLAQLVGQGVDPFTALARVDMEPMEDLLAPKQEEHAPKARGHEPTPPEPRREPPPGPRHGGAPPSDVLLDLRAPAGDPPQARIEGGVGGRHGHASRDVAAPRVPPRNRAWSEDLRRARELGLPDPPPWPGDGLSRPEATHAAASRPRPSASKPIGRRDVPGTPRHWRDAIQTKPSKEGARPRARGRVPHWRDAVEEIPVDWPDKPPAPELPDTKHLLPEGLRPGDRVDLILEAPGPLPDKVARVIGILLSVDKATSKRILEVTPVVLAEGLDQKTALDYSAVLRRTLAKIRLEPAGSRA